MKIINEKELKERLEVFCQDGTVNCSIISKDMGVSPSLISHWRAGRRGLSANNMNKLHSIIEQGDKYKELYSTSTQKDLFDLSREYGGVRKLMSYINKLEDENRTLQEKLYVKS